MNREFDSNQWDRVCVRLRGCALIGMLLQAVLPEHHLSTDSKDVVKLGIGVIGTMAALVLGLLIATAQSSFHEQRGDIQQLSANIILLDRVLAHYGPETKEARDLLHSVAVNTLNQMLFGLALFCAVLAGYGMASTKRRAWIHIIGFVAITVITIYVILDMEHPR